MLQLPQALPLPLPLLARSFDLTSVCGRRRRHREKLPNHRLSCDGSTAVRGGSVTVHTEL